MYTTSIPPGKYFILTYIKQMDAREQIIDYLSSKGYIEGKDFLHPADNRPPVFQMAFSIEAPAANCLIEVGASALVAIGS